VPLNVKVRRCLSLQGRDLQYYAAGTSESTYQCYAFIELSGRSESNSQGTGRIYRNLQKSSILELHQLLAITSWSSASVPQLDQIETLQLLCC
jgi:hypothetical protein